MAEILFPKRQRCKKCGKGLGAKGAPVYKGLYDTPRCAGMAAPIEDPEKAPRECKTQREGRWEFKRRYRSADEIPDRIRDDPSTNWYTCGNCQHLHIGHTRMGEAEAFRGLRDRQAIADWLIKLRGGASHAEVAKVAQARGASRKVLAIRIKEWEDPKHKEPSLEALWPLLRVYRIDLAAVFR